MTDYFVDRTAIEYQIRRLYYPSVERPLTYKPIWESVDSLEVTDMHYALCKLGAQRHLSHLL